MKADTYVPWAAAIAALFFILGIHIGASSHIILESINIFSSFLLSVSTASLALCAWIGVNQWKKEIRGKSEFDMALNFMKIAMNLRDTVQGARGPIHPNELSVVDQIQAVPIVGRSEYEQHMLSVKPHQDAWRKRSIIVSSALVELEDMYVVIEIFFGRECVTQTKNMARRVQRYLTAIDWEIGNLGRGDSTIDELENAAVLIKSLKTGNPDDFTIGIEGDVEELRKYTDKYFNKS